MLNQAVLVIMGSSWLLKDFKKKKNKASFTKKLRGDAPIQAVFEKKKLNSGAGFRYEQLYFLKKSCEKGCLIFFKKEAFKSDEDPDHAVYGRPPGPTDFFSLCCRRVGRASKLKSKGEP